MSGTFWPVSIRCRAVDWSSPMQELLEKIYRQDLHAPGFVERRFDMPQGSFTLSGLPLSGKTALIKHHLLQRPKSSYLYVDCSDIRIEAAAFNAAIASFCREHAIDTLVLDNYRETFARPSVERLILVGRTTQGFGLPVRRLHPLDFEEFLAFERRYDEGALNDFLQLGGFPAMHRTPSEERHLLLQRTFLSALGENGFALLHAAAKVHTQKVSPYMLYQRLKTERKISKDMLYRTFERMVQEGYLHTVEKFGYPRATKKLYLCDIALKNALVFKKHFGRLFESMVLQELIKRSNHVTYAEKIDFYLPKDNRVVLCMPFGTKELLFKKIESAEAFLLTHAVRRVEVVTMSSESMLHHPFVEAEMIPFSQWALGQ